MKSPHSNSSPSTSLSRFPPPPPFTVKIGNKVAPSEKCSSIKLAAAFNNKNKNLEMCNSSSSSAFPTDGGGNIPPPAYLESVSFQRAAGKNASAKCGKESCAIQKSSPPLCVVDERGELRRTSGLSFPVTLLNFLKTLVGAGFLALPLAFKNAGLWSALIMIIVFAFLNCLCMMQLVKCAQYHYRSRGIPFLSYGGLAQQTCSISFRWIRPYGRLLKAIVDTTILFLEFGFCSTYYLFIAVTLKEFYMEFFQISSAHSTLQWLMAIYVPMVLFNFLRTLRVIAWLSTVGNVCLVGSLTFLLQYVIRNPKHSIGEMPFYNGLDGLLTAAGSIIYSFEAQTLVLPMENKLKRPGQMLGPFGILSSGILLASLVYSSIGFFGYVAYGDEVKGSITLNLPQHQIQFTLVKVAICVSVLASFLLQMYVIVEIAWSKCCQLLFENANDDFEEGMARGRKLERRGGDEKNDEWDDDEGKKKAKKEEGRQMEGQKSGVGAAKQQPRESFCYSSTELEPEDKCSEKFFSRRWWSPPLPEHFKLGTELLLRSLLVTVCFLFAAAVPNLEQIIPLVGITSGMLLAFVYPALIDLLTFLPQMLQTQGWSSWRVRLRVVVDLALAVVGLFGMVAGLRADIIEMVVAASAARATHLPENSSVNATMNSNAAFLHLNNSSN